MTPECLFDLCTGRVLDLTEGYDRNFCLALAPRAPAFAAELTGRSGLRMIMETTEPGLQVYCGRGLRSGVFPSHTNQPYAPYARLALEAQRWPDAPNHPDSP